MSVATAIEPTARATDSAGFIDCDIHPALANRKALHPYLAERWRRHLDEYGGFGHGFYAGRATYPRLQPAAARRDAWPGEGKPPGSDLAFMRAQHLDAYGVKYGILIPLIDTHSSRNSELAAAACSASNDWQLDAFAGPEPRLKASIVVNGDDAAAAVAEIERRAHDRRFAQVLLGSRSLEPIGRRRYWPIFAAAQAANFPIGFHVGGPAAFPPAPGGWPSYYIEYHQVVGQSGQSQLTSLIVEGVFEQFPRLRVAIMECGFAWVPPLAWRLDKLVDRLHSEVPYLKRRPSEYLKEHVWLTTQPIDEPERRGDLAQLIDWVGWDRIMFSTDYPHWDFDDPNRALPVALGEQQRRAIFHDNAMRFFANLDG